MKTKDRRSQELALIHMAAKQLVLDRESYEAMLWTVCRVKSARDLDAAGRHAVLDHLKGRGFKPRPKGRTTPSKDREALIGKLRALAREANVFDRYLDGMASKMFGLSRFEFGTPEQLHKMVAAMSYHIKRHGRHDSRS